MPAFQVERRQLQRLRIVGVRQERHQRSVGDRFGDDEIAQPQDAAAVQRNAQRRLAVVDGEAPRELDLDDAVGRAERPAAPCLAAEDDAGVVRKLRRRARRAVPQCPRSRR